MIGYWAQAQKDTLKKPPVKVVDPKVTQKVPVQQKPTTTKPTTTTAAGKDIIYVKHDATAGSNNGTSWLNAYRSLQDALNAAVAGKSIWVARGIYKPTTTLDRNASFRLKNNVSMYGGFAGTESNLSERNLTRDSTFLDGDIGMAGNHRDNSYNIIYAKGIGSSTIINGFCIRNANADRVTQILPGSSGGGIYIEGSLAGTNVVFKHCTIKDNRATWGGGVVITCIQVRGPDNGGGNPRFDTCRFSWNNAGNMGGAVYIDSYWQHFNPVFSGCTFEANKSGQGGAIYHSLTMGNSNPRYENCLFSLNEARQRGAAVCQSFGSDAAGLPSGVATPVYDKCIFRNNQNGFSAQGTMFFTNAYGRTYIVEVKNSVFEYRGTASTSTKFGHSGGAFHNSSLSGGGIHLKVTNSIFSKLQCGGNGGVIYNSSRAGTTITADFTNCVFAENYGCNGGVVYGTTEGAGSRNSTNIYNSVLYYNYFQPGSAERSCGRGEDFYLNTADATATMVNCLTNKSDCDVMKGGLGRLTCTGMIFATDPLFTDFAGQNYLPQAGSPLIDAGNDTYISTIARDILGMTRRQGSRVDIGPYELR